MHGHLAPSHTFAVLRLLHRAALADGRHAMSEQARLTLRGSVPRAVTHLLLYEGTDLAGYGQLEHAGPATLPSAEMVVHPHYRRRGHGLRLGRALLDECGGRMRMWAHGGHTGAQRLADLLGLTLHRELLQLRCAVSDLKLREPQFPPGVMVRTFEPGADDAEWLAVNAAAFADHPEQGLLSQADLDARKVEPWFDAGSFFLAVKGVRVLGFAWCKVHDAEHLGEGYAAGVLPAERGLGLGAALYSVMFRHLAQASGVDTVMGYVDSDNVPSLLLCERMGLRRYESDLMYYAGG
ncbi:mycothiol synthase [Streptomyces sp. NPDC019890]|uniref:mycothiol synthase n=1 Tax=Streptomyces sp. NPDC019890 TaxID=3365064 RepID=UPI00384D68B3